MKDERWSLWLKIVIVVTAGFIAFTILNITKINIIEAIGAISTKGSLWWSAKIVVFFFAFVFFCHGPMVWMGFLFSIEDGKGKIVYSKDRIWALKITYYGRHLDEGGNVVEDEKNNFLKPFKWFKNYFFGSLHILGIPGIHNVDKDTYEWERLNPMTGKAEPATGVRGEFPLREFIPSIGFENLDVTGGQINTKIGPQIKITNPIKTATVARDWFPFFVDMMRGYIREFFAPCDFFRVMISKKNFGRHDEKNKEDNEGDAGDLSSEIFTYFKSPEKEVDVETSSGTKKMTLLEFIEHKYGIKIIKFYVMDPDPAEASKELLNSISKPEQAKLIAKETVIKARGEADAFNKKREAMIKPGGKLLR